MKKCILMISLMLGITSVPAQTQINGDMNHDGKIDVTDVASLTNTIVLGKSCEYFLPKQTYTVNGVSFNMIPVKGGTFQMGATSEQSGDASSNESPAHSVTLSNYAIGETEVTQALWYAVMEDKPSIDYNWNSSNGLGDNYPAYYISYDDCLEFITKLNSLTGMSFRLPTEAEWEYAARGGNMTKKYKYSGSNTIANIAWFNSNSSSSSHEVGTKGANELGIYDMSGNVWEWCSDWYGSYSSNAQTNPTGPTSGTDRVRRSGCWGNSATNCRVSYRNYSTPTSRLGNLGLRLAGINSVAAQEQINGDMNHDGKIDVSDVAFLMNTILGSKDIEYMFSKHTYTVNGVSFNMIPVQGGRFQMGATDEQVSDADKDESPVHNVTLSDYAIGETEVTQALWRAVMNGTTQRSSWSPSFGSGDNFPAYYASYKTCLEFITRLNSLTGETFRLPTEAEWEYAARGGNRSKGYKYAGSNDISDVAWYSENSNVTSHIVGTKASNELGLYDMSGNVYELCSDYYDAYSSSAQTNPTGATSGPRLYRGGCWDNKANKCRVSYRGTYITDYFQGLRLAK